MAQEKITRAHEFAPEFKFTLVNFEEKNCRYNRSS